MYFPTLTFELFAFNKQYLSNVMIIEDVSMRWYVNVIKGNNNSMMDPPMMWVVSPTCGRDNYDAFADKIWLLFDREIVFEIMCSFNIN